MFFDGLIANNGIVPIGATTVRCLASYYVASFDDNQTHSSFPTGKMEATFKLLRTVSWASEILLRYDLTLRVNSLKNFKKLIQVKNK